MRGSKQNEAGNYFPPRRHSLGPGAGPVMRPPCPGRETPLSQCKSRRSLFRISAHFSHELTISWRVIAARPSRTLVARAVRPLWAPDGKFGPPFWRGVPAASAPAPRRACRGQAHCWPIASWTLGVSAQVLPTIGGPSMAYMFLITAPIRLVPLERRPDRAAPEQRARGSRAAP